MKSLVTKDYDNEEMKIIKTKIFNYLLNANRQVSICEIRENFNLPSVKASAIMKLIVATGFVYEHKNKKEKKVYYGVGY